MVRSAYNARLKGKRYAYVKRMLKERHHIENARWRQWAINEADANIKSQRQLLPLYAENLTWKIKRVKDKVARTANPLKRKGYEARVSMLEAKKRFYERHIRSKTVPKAVFGSKKLFKKLAKSLIESREELLKRWRQRRNSQFCSVGQANQNGNANTRIIRDGMGFLLEVRNWPPEDFIIPLHIPDVYVPIFEAIADGLIPCYTVRVVKRENGGIHCFVSFEVDETPIVDRASRHVGSVDVNPTRLDVTILRRDGNLKATKTFKEPALIYASRNKRMWLASNLVERALRWIESYGVNTLVMEDLKLNSPVEYGKHANRIIANFMHKKLKQLLKIKALKMEWIICEEDPAWTSAVAEAEYKKQFPRLSVHQLAAYVLGRRALGFGENLSQESLEAIPKRNRGYAQAYAWSFYGHGHPSLMPRTPTNGRIGVEDAKGAEPLTERVTPHTRKAVRLSWFFREPATGEGSPDAGGARGHRVNPPRSPFGLSVYQPSVAMSPPNANIANV
jgi:hypothetical protein